MQKTIEFKPENWGPKPTITAMADIPSEESTDPKVRIERKRESLIEALNKKYYKNN